MRSDRQAISKAALRKRRASGLRDRLAFPGDLTDIRSFPGAAALAGMDIAAKLLGVGHEGELPFGAIEHAHNCTIRAVIGQLSSERPHRNAGGQALDAVNGGAAQASSRRKRYRVL